MSVLSVLNELNWTESELYTSRNGFYEAEDLYSASTKTVSSGSNIRLDPGKDHIYRMVIVDGCCTMARSSSLGANCSLVDTKV